MIRIAAGSGFWGDWPQAPRLQVESGPIDYLVMDYLAEVTLSLMHRQKARNPTAGYAADFVTDIAALLPTLLDRNIRVIANAGGANPRACAEAVCATAAALGIAGLRVAVVTGDDLLADRGGSVPLESVVKPFYPDGRPFSSIASKLVGAHAYCGVESVVEALHRDAQIIITGRVADPSLFLAPYLHEFQVGPRDWDARALGTVVGHILECGGQASGGNFMGDWESVPHLHRLGFPIAEFESADKAVITKHDSLGGLVSPATIKEQLVYEIGDPTRYVTPDCVSDFTTIELREIGANRVEVSGVRGADPPEKLKVAAYYESGWMISGQLTYTWPEARRKAEAAGRLIEQRSRERVGDRVNNWRVEVIGAGACHGALQPAIPEPEEVTLRVTAFSEDRAALDEVGREFAPLILTGPPGATGFAGGRPKPSPVFAYWPGLIDRNEVEPVVEVFVS